MGLTSGILIKILLGILKGKVRDMRKMLEQWKEVMEFRRINFEEIEKFDSKY